MRRRFTASLLTCAFIAGQLLLFVHQTIVPHAICAQHGEWVETGDGAEHGLELRGQAGSPEPSLVQGGVDESHEHCAAMMHRREEQQPFAAGYTLDWEGSFESPSPVHGSPLRSAIAVYRTAPKHSPPL
jgi:hypothetical protein